jgi:phytoene synthase
LTLPATSANRSPALTRASVTPPRSRCRPRLVAASLETASHGPPTRVRDVDRRFPIPLAGLDDLIGGAESDLHGASNDTFDDFVHYCRQVASSVGRLSVAVLGSRDPAAAAQLADDFGVAIQLTNVLHDLVRDSQRGRVCLTREDVELVGSPADPLSAAPALLDTLIRRQVPRERRSEHIERPANGVRLARSLGHGGRRG